MKRIAFLLLLISGFFVAHAQTESKATEVLQVKETEYDFGTIPQGKPVFHNFEIMNSGSKPLKLDNVQASCGCTTPEWGKEAIGAHSTAQIKVGYNAAGEGYFQKYITVTYNGNQTKQIIIKGNVWRTPDGAAPANASVRFLKQLGE